MKLSTVILVIASLQIMATGYSQTVPLNFNGDPMSVREMLKEIERQTELSFIFSDDYSSLNNEVSIIAQNLTIKDVLTQLFVDTDLGYQILNEKLIVIAPKHVLQGIVITGTVTEADGSPLPGATIMIKGTAQGTITDANGVYTLQVPGENATLMFSYIGFSNQEVIVGNQRNINIILLEDARRIDEVVVVGYGTQRKVTLTGSIATIKGTEMLVTKNENPQNMLTGKVSGVRVTQRTAEPGNFQMNFDIRAMGTPLIVIDGVPRPMSDFQRLNANDIDDITVLKDASAAIYGVRGANGVVMITTKKGSMAEGKPKLNYSGNYYVQVPSGFPASLDAIDFMTLKNEGFMHNINGGQRPYTEEMFDDYRSGRKTSTDWYPLVFAKWFPQTEHNLSVTGGTERTQYYIGMGYHFKQGMYQSKDLTYDRYNVRSNITTKITDRLTFDLNLGGTIDETSQPWRGTWWVIRAYWRQPAHAPAYADPAQTMPYYGLIEGDNPLVFMDQDLTGYKKFGNKILQSSASLKYEIPGIKGLELKGLFSYDHTMSDNRFKRKKYYQYQYDEATDTYRQYVMGSPDHIERESFLRTQTLGQLSLSYANVFGAHNVTGLLVLETQKQNRDNFYARRDMAFPMDYIMGGVTANQEGYMYTGSGDLYIYTNNAFIGKFNYGFSDKYLAEFLFRYDGSSKFAPGPQQWGFFPAASVGWRVSEEEFFKKSPLSFINNLKFRASYGVSGDDGASSYQFISGYNYPTPGTSAREFSAGYVFDGSFSASADNKGIPNTLITWYTGKTLNIGVDWDAWNGLFGGSFEYFSRKREGLLTARTGGIPTVVGAGLPQENLNSDRHFGLELELKHHNRIGEVSYSVRGLASITRQKRLYVERASDNSSWSNWKNNNNDRLQGIQSGYGAAGRYTSWEQIWNSPVRISRGTILGDYIYEDWDGDGMITGYDEHPIRFNQFPWVNFSLMFENVTWKNFDLYVQFQGSAMASYTYREQLYQPFWGHGEANAMQQFMDRWHPVDPSADPYDPSIKWVSGYYGYSGSNPYENSEFNIVDGAYLRLKTVEFGYSLPKIKGIQNLRIYVNAYNMLTITKVKWVDPEHADNDMGYWYPLTKTVSFGLNVTL